MKKSIKTFVRREFLNLKDFCGGAIIKCGVFGKSYEIKITDCNKSIFLHGKFESKEEMDNTIYKLDIIIDVINDMKNDIVEKYEEIRKEDAKKKARAKTKKFTGNSENV